MELVASCANKEFEDGQFDDADESQISCWINGAPSLPLFKNISYSYSAASSSKNTSYAPCWSQNISLPVAKPVVSEPSSVVDAQPVCDMHHDTTQSGTAVRSANLTEEKPNDHDKEGNISFYPPLYIQRYNKMRDIIQSSFDKESSLKVVDFGAAECKLFRRWIRPLEMVSEYLAVDVAAGHSSLSEIARMNIKPEIGDYLAKRKRPLHVMVLEGSVVEPDPRIFDLDVALMVEIVEHLHPPELELLPERVFGLLRPKLVVVTTPNSDFNVCFGPSFTGFRHWDHKFEWTRHEFEAWAQPIAETYGYSVEFSGLGAPPENMSSVGYCTQIAVFRRQNADVNLHLDSSSFGSFKVVYEIHYPYQPEKPRSESLSEDVIYYARRLMMYERKRNDSCGSSFSSASSSQHNFCRVAMESLLRHPCLKHLEPTMEELTKILSDSGFVMRDNNIVALPDDEDTETDADVDSDSDNLASSNNDSVHLRISDSEVMSA